MTKHIPVDVKNKYFYSFSSFKMKTHLLQKQKPFSSKFSTEAWRYIEKYIRRTT